MATCNSCGGQIGQDCFNPQECAEISAQTHQASTSINEQLRIACSTLAAGLWHPMSEYDGKNSILRPHIFYGPMTVQPNKLKSARHPHEWACVSNAVGWPEDAFLPYFMARPEMPAGWEEELKARMAPPLPTIDDEEFKRMTKGEA